MGSDRVKTGRIVKRKVAASMMKVEEKTQYLSSAGKYDLTEVIHGDLDKAVYGDIPDVASLGRRPRKPDLAKEYRLNRMDLLNKRSKAEKSFIDNIKTDIKSGKDESKYCTLSDMLESTGNFDVAPLGYGHGGKKYWSNYETTSTEFVAEMTESLAKDPEKLKIMEKYMPNAAKKYYELLDTISNS
ncbi:hypothetical protein [Companilactobacillus nodensis]|nr:hypothetical protein [Companilactobacillus nodensis]